MKDSNPAQIRALYSTRHLSANPKGKDFVNGLKLANEELMLACTRLYSGTETPVIRETRASSQQEDETLTAYAHFVRQHWAALTEPNLVSHCVELRNLGG